MKIAEETQLTFAIMLIPFCLSLYLKSFRAHECFVWGQASWIFSCDLKDAEREEYNKRTADIRARNAADLETLKIRDCETYGWNRDFDCRIMLKDAGKEQEALPATTENTIRLVP